jgi:hypothetical protein
MGGFMPQTSQDKKVELDFYNLRLTNQSPYKIAEKWQVSGF